LHYSKHDLQNKCITEFILANHQEQFGRFFFKKGYELNKQITVKICNKWNSYLPLKFHLITIKESEKSLQHFFFAWFSEKETNPQTGLIELEQRFDYLFNNIKDSILVLTHNHEILNANNTLYRITGYHPDSFLHTTALNYIPEQYHGEVKKRINKLIDGHSLPPAEIEILHKEGFSIPVEINSRKIYYDHQPAVLTVLRNIADRKKVEKIRTFSMLEAEEKERKRIAQDLHDETGPLLSTLSLYASLLKSTCQDNSAIDIIDHITGLTSTITDSIRHISNDLSPHILENFGLVPAIENFIDNQSGLIKFHFDSNCRSMRFDQNLETIYYRIFTELYHNTLKHAEATIIHLEVVYYKKNLKLFYRDNGKGFAIEEIKKDPSSGKGWFNIFNRINSIGGTYKLNANPGRGMFFELNSST
jgi:PAS domain S-box-containing protein